VNIQLKQRLVGAIVLVALAVIFIPMLLPGEGSLSDAIHGSNIPPEPDYRFAPIKPAPKAPPMAEAPAVPLGDKEGDVEGDAETKSTATAGVDAPAAADRAKETLPPAGQSSVTKAEKNRKGGGEASSHCQSKTDGQSEADDQGKTGP